MLEFVVVFFLARKNGQIAQDKGLSPTKYQWGTAGLWFGLEFFGFVLGGILIGPRADVLELYPFGIVGAVSGAVIAYYWAKQAPTSPYAQYMAFNPTHVASTAGMPGWATPDGTQTPTAMIPPGAELTLLERQADWARVRAVNGWVGWVDGRELQARYDPPVFTDSAKT